jgi:hypothetical protein
MTPLNGGERSGGRPACGIGVPIRTDLDLEEVVVGCRGGGTRRRRCKANRKVVKLNARSGRSGVERGREQTKDHHRSGRMLNRCVAVVSGGG